MQILNCCCPPLFGKKTDVDELPMGDHRQMNRLACSDPDEERSGGLKKLTSADDRPTYVSLFFTGLTTAEALHVSYVSLVSPCPFQARRS